MNNVKELINYSADKQYKFQEGNNDWTACAAYSDNGQVNAKLFVFYADHKGVVSVTLVAQDEYGHRDCVRLIEDSKASAENLYKRILKSIEEKKTAINNQIQTCQQNYNYVTQAKAATDYLKDIPGIRIHADGDIRGYYSEYGKLEGKANEKSVTLEFSTDKKAVAEILKCLLDNGIIKAE